MKKILITSISLVIIAMIIIQAKGLLEHREAEVNGAKTSEKELISISTINPRQGKLEISTKFLSQVESDKSIKISTKMAGYIEKLYVHEGERVSKGQLLATIDENDLNSNIELLKITLSQQKNDFILSKQIYSRNKELYDIGGLSKEQFDTSKVIMQGKNIVVKSTYKKIEQLNKQKSYLNIISPFNGIIDHVQLHQGDLAITGKSILIMSNGVKKLTFLYSTSNSNIEKDKKVFYEGENIGEITLIKTLAKKGLSQAEITLNKELTIPVGSSINIDILIQTATGCIVPNETLIHKKNKILIMVYKNKKFEPLKIDIVLQNNLESILSSCPENKIAIGNEIELIQLEAYGIINIIENNNE